MIERNGQLAHREDADVAAAILDLFRDEGIDVVLDATVVRVEAPRSPDGRGRAGEFDMAGIS